jgi:hypothetical protein
MIETLQDPALRTARPRLSLSAPLAFMSPPIRSGSNGINICCDTNFPEAACKVADLGASLIVSAANNVCRRRGGGGTQGGAQFRAG